MPTPVIAQIGGLSQTGLATESTFGTYVPATTLLPATESTISPDPGLFYIDPMAGYRDSQWFPMFGQYKFTGALASALFPSNGSALLAASIASDNQVAYGITGSTPLQATTLNGGTIAGATSITVTSAGSDYIVGAIVQIDTNSVTSGTTTECRKITAVSSNTLTIDQGLTYAHATGVAVSVVSAPFTHTMHPGPTLGSMSVTTRVGNSQAEEWAGVRVNKWNLKSQATNTAVEHTADVVAQSVVINDSPPVVGITNETPFQWVGLTMNYNSLNLNQANNLNLSIDNKLVEDYTFAQQHNVQFITPSGLMTSGSFEVIYNSLDDTDWGFFKQLLPSLGGGISESLTLTFVGGTNTLTITLPEVNLKTYKDTMKAGDPIRTSLNFEAAVSLTSVPVQTLTATLANAQYLPF